MENFRKDIEVIYI